MLTFSHSELHIAQTALLKAGGKSSQKARTNHPKPNFTLVLVFGCPLLSILYFKRKLRLFFQLPRSELYFRSTNGLDSDYLGMKKFCKKRSEQLRKADFIRILGSKKKTLQKIKKNKGFGFWGFRRPKLYINKYSYYIMYSYVKLRPVCLQLRTVFWNINSCRKYDHRTALKFLQRPETYLESKNLVDQALIGVERSH